MHALRGEVVEGLDPAAGRDDLIGGDASAQQRLDGEPAEVAGGSGDDDGHGTNSSGRGGGGRQGARRCAAVRDTPSCTAVGRAGNASGSTGRRIMSAPTTRPVCTSAGSST